MFKSYVIIAFRNLYKNKLYSVINIVGLGTAMALCVVAYVNHEFSQSFNTFHERSDEIYMVNAYDLRNDRRQDYTNVPTPLAPAIASDIPGVEQYVRFWRNSGSVRYGDLVFDERLNFVDPDFFDLFTFPMLLGDKNALHDMTSIIVTDEMASKYFGDEDPIGKHVVISPDGENEFDFVVRGVVAKPASNSSILMTFCLPYEAQVEMYGFEIDEWSDWTGAAFVTAGKAADPARITEQLQQYVARTNQANPNFQMEGFYLTAFPEMAIFVREHGGPFRSAMHPAAIVAPSITAFLVLLLTCFNFINTAVAFASRRLNEIGVRKTMGALRGQLVRQFIGENLVLCLAALLVAAVLAEIFVPAYDSLWPDLSLSISYSENLGLVGFFVAMLLFTGIAAGAYPALYVSSFNPVEIFKGKQKLVGTNPLIRVLLAFQLALSMTVIIAALVFTKNADFIDAVDLGYQKDNVVAVPVSGEEQYLVLKNAIESHPGIEKVGGTRHVIGRGWYAVNAESGDVSGRVSVFDVGEDYFETLGFRLAEGRSFDKDKPTDVLETILVNQTLAARYGMETGAQNSMRFAYQDSIPEYRVVGVAEDYKLFGIEVRMRPTAMRFVSPERYRYLVARTSDESAGETRTYIENTWKQLFPHHAYGGMWIDETLAESKQVNESIKLVFSYIAGMVMIISSMGIFALVSLNISRRTKEIGIRKALGATVPHICYLIAREFMVLIAVGGVLASAMAYFLVKALMSSIWDYYTDFGVMPFALAVLIVFCISVVTVGIRVITAANANPVDALRYE
jgi:ABC-type lipoprotein release transport system permease subunit